MTTARQLISKAFQKAGIITKQESPSADEMFDALDTLNDLLESWSNDSLYIYARNWQQFTFVGGQSDYTIGSGGDFDTSRPLAIVSAYTRLGTSDYPMQQIADKDYAYGISQKTTAGVPDFFNYDNDFPLGKLRFWPAPSAAYPVYIQTEDALTSLTINQVISLPQGWRRALIYSLAVELAPEYGQPLDQAVVGIAVDAQGKIKRQISKMRSMDKPKANNYFNIYRGWTS